MKPVVFSDPASDELEQAALTYERGRVGYGVRLRDAVVAAVALIADHPAIGEKVGRSVAGGLP